MTPLHKLSLAVLILGSALFTARFLHRDRAEEWEVWRRPAPTPRPLVWQVRTDGLAAPTALSPVHPSEAGSLNSEVASAADRPASFDSQVRFAALQNVGSEAQSVAITSSPAATELKGDPTTADFQSANVPTGSSPDRPLIPLVLARPKSKLSEVRRHEVAVAQAPVAAEFTHHTVQFGDTLPQLAGKYLGNREEYLAIYLANQDVLTSPVELTPGVVLKIPVHR